MNENLTKMDFTKADLKEGVYPATITSAKKHLSQSGNTCMKITVNIDDGSDSGVTMSKFLVKEKLDGSEPNKGQWKQLGKALGLSAEDLTEAWARDFDGCDADGVYHFFDRYTVRAVVKSKQDSKTGYGESELAALLPPESEE